MATLAAAAAWASAIAPVGDRAGDGGRGVDGAADPVSNSIAIAARWTEPRASVPLRTLHTRVADTWPVRGEVVDLSGPSSCGWSFTLVTPKGLLLCLITR